MTKLHQEPSLVLFGHPKGLFYLFFAELWERFSFYGMRSLLVLYMTKQLIFTDTVSFGVYSAYMSLVYLSPIIGGMVAEKILGYRKSIWLGGLFMTLGHFLLSFENPLCFYTSLSLLIIGCGFFKPTISSLVGALYEKEDIRRDAGFTIFYMGINVGSSTAPLLCAWVAVTFGWHYGFVLAGIGMLAGLLFFYRGIKDNVFGNLGLAPVKEIDSKTTPVPLQDKRILFFSMLAIPVFALLIYFHAYQTYVVWIATVIIFFMLYNIYRKVEAVEKRRLTVIVYFTILYTIFSAVFEQGGSSLTLYADRNVNLVGINAAQTNSINGFFIVLLAIPLSLLWTFLERKKKNPASPVKFGIGILLLGFGFIVFALSAKYMDEEAKTPMFFLVMGYLIQTIGELFLSPAGLSKMTELSPKKYVSFIFGVWFLGAFYGQFLAGKIASLTSVTPGENPFSQGLAGDIVWIITGLSPANHELVGHQLQQLYAYVSVYAVFGVVTLGIGVLALVLAPVIKKRMGGIH